MKKQHHEEEIEQHKNPFPIKKKRKRFLYNSDSNHSIQSMWI